MKVIDLLLPECEIVNAINECYGSKTKPYVNTCMKSDKAVAYIASLHTAKYIVSEMNKIIKDDDTMSSKLKRLGIFYRYIEAQIKEMESEK